MSYCTSTRVSKGVGDSNKRINKLSTKRCWRGWQVTSCKIKITDLVPYKKIHQEQIYRRETHTSSSMERWTGVESVISLKNDGSLTVQSTHFSIPMATTGYLKNMATSWNKQKSFSNTIIFTVWIEKPWAPKSNSEIVHCLLNHLKQSQLHEVYLSINHSNFLQLESAVFRLLNMVSEIFLSVHGFRFAL